MNDYKGMFGHSTPLTVENMCVLPDFPNLELISGESGLKNIIENVSLFDSIDAFKWHRGRDIVITTFVFVPPDLYEEVFQKLSEINVSGIVLCYPELNFVSVPQPLIDLSNQYGIPLFTASKEVRYVDIITPILNEIVGKDLITEFKLKIASEYRNLLLKGGHFSDVISFMHSFLHLPLILMDKDFDIVALKEQCEESNDLSNFIENDLYKLFSKPATNLNISKKQIIFEKNEQNISIIIYPVIGNDSVLGNLLIFNKHSLNAEESIVIEQGLEILAIIFSVNHANKQSNINFKKELFNYITKSLVSENDFKVFKEIAFMFGLNKNDGLRLVLIRFNDNASDNSIIKKRRSSLLKEKINKYFNRAIWIDNDDWFLVVIPFISPSQGQSSITSFSTDVCLNFKGTKLYISSHIYDMCELRDSYQLIVKAQLITDIPGYNGGDICWIDQIEFLIHLSDAIKYDKSFYIWAEKMLEPLIKYSTENNYDLIETTRILLLENSNLKQLSEKLFIHTNTLLYRKKIIERLLNDDPFGKNRFIYSLAFHLYSLKTVKF